MAVLVKLLTYYPYFALNIPTYYMSKKLEPAPHLQNIDNLNESMRCTYYVRAVMDSLIKVHMFRAISILDDLFLSTN
jgi:hypothetical protein